MDSKRCTIISENELACLKQHFEELQGGLKHEERELDRSPNGAFRFVDAFRFINSTYFFETAANFGATLRSNHFFNSLKQRDRFVAKVLQIFERSAEVLLVWSPKRDIFDLKIKADLKLVERKRFSYGHSSIHHSQNEPNDENNLEISELIFVEVIYCNQSKRQIEVSRVKSLDSYYDEDFGDEDGISSKKYKSKQPSDQSFHDYMLDHKDFRNPSLLKVPPFTSLIHRLQVVDSLQRVQSKKRQLNLANALSVDGVRSSEANLAERLASTSDNSDQTQSQGSSVANRLEQCEPRCVSPQSSSQPKRQQAKAKTSSKRSRSSSPNSERKKKLSPQTSSSSFHSSSDSDGYEHRRHKSRNKRKKHKKHKRKSKKQSSKKKKRRHHSSSDSDSSSQDRSERKSRRPKKSIDEKILKLLEFN